MGYAFLLSMAVIYQLGWVSMPRYAIKHYPEHFCEGVFALDEHLNW